MKELFDAEQQVQNVQQAEGHVIEIIAHRGDFSVFPENILASFAGEKLPILWEALELIRDTECKVYLEIKDIGEKEDFKEAVLKVVNECGMIEQCVFVSFQYKFL